MSGDPAPVRPRPGPVVTLGECLVSLVARERGPLAEASTFVRTVAGAEANVAVGLARLGVDAAYIGRVGADGLGRAIMRRLRGEGVDVRHVRVDAAAPTGVMIRELRDVGPSEVVYWRQGSAGSRLGPEDVEAAGALLDAAAWLHVTGITPALSPSSAAAVDLAIVRARSAGAAVSLDVNLRRRLWSDAQAAATLAPLAARCHVVLGGVEELAVLAGLGDEVSSGALPDPVRAADAVLAMGSASVVVKLGADGALLRRRESVTDPDHETNRATGRDANVTLTVPAYPVERVIDPIGAGDAFTAGYIATVLGGGSEEQALRAANACGASAVATLGDQSGSPTRAELDTLLAWAGADTVR